MGQVVKVAVNAEPPLLGGGFSPGPTAVSPRVADGCPSYDPCTGPGKVSLLQRAQRFKTRIEGARDIPEQQSLGDCLKREPGG